MFKKSVIDIRAFTSVHGDLEVRQGLVSADTKWCNMSLNYFLNTTYEAQLHLQFSGSLLAFRKCVHVLPSGRFVSELHKPDAKGDVSQGEQHPIQVSVLKRLPPDKKGDLSPLGLTLLMQIIFGTDPSDADHLWAWPFWCRPWTDVMGSLQKLRSCNASEM